MAENFREELLTGAGRSFVEELVTSLREDGSIDDVKEEYEVDSFRGGSLGRIVLPFPDEFVQEGFTESTELETFYVIKVSGTPLPHNYREIKVWEKAVELGWDHESLFAPIDAWDEKEYKWLIMRRATPVSPIEDDIAYLLSGQKYVINPDAPKRMEEQLNELGWTVEDIEMNVGIIDGGYCLMDYGGVNRENEPIEPPEWMTK